MEFFSAIIGAISIIFYSDYVSNRQEKAVLILIVQEFILLFNRMTMYYEQSLKGNISYSASFEIIDSSTFNALVEVGKNSEVIKTAIELKSSFFQVLRYANLTSQYIAESQMEQSQMNLQSSRLEGLQNKKEIGENISGIENEIKEAVELYRKAHNKYQKLCSKAQHARSLAIVFFVGEMYVGKKFTRNRYLKYISNISLLLEYLLELNSQNKILAFLIHFFPWLKKQNISVNELIRENVKILSDKKILLSQLREEEKESQGLETRL